ncbi:hypothetical protein ACTWQB_13200 [Piscibacillus sp. B03]|uniref:hypothetical protein n=1 Tax=Piscibacillus sp. B03 TaxID=3457430 RepID=UPI003FCE9815
MTALVVFFTISWFVVALYFVMDKKINILDGTFVYLITLIIAINFSWIVIEELKLITLTEKGQPYMAYIFKRSIITPTVALICLALVLRTRNTFFQVSSIILSVAFLTFTNYLLVPLNVATYNNWNIAYDVLYFIGIIGLSLMSYYLFHKITKNAVLTK